MIKLLELPAVMAVPVTEAISEGVVRDAPSESPSLLGGV